jgi:outer membrane protein assembly factor BamE (lipoprotein component of BamABCDE complex)
MSVWKRRVAMAAACITVLIGAGGCSRIVGHQGYLLDTQLVSTVQPGVDNKQSVQRTLGQPSFTSQFGQSDWYYVARETRQLAFGKPRPISQTVLHVQFDPVGNVASVRQLGVDQVASINPTDATTPTLGRKRGFFEDLFGNIGQVGTIGGGGRGGADNTGG